MIVGILTMELFLSGATSLKEKRRILKSLLDKVKARFNVSVAEVGKQDTWQLSTIGVSVVSTDSIHAHKVLASVVRFVEKQGELELIDYSTQLL